MPDTTEITRVLNAAARGERGAADLLLPLVYGDLKAMAEAAFARERSGHTLQPTALVNEVWLKLERAGAAFESRRHFFAVASKVMRQVLADYARGRGRLKRGGGARPVTLVTDTDAVAAREIDLVAFDDSLRRLAEINERHARIVELRFLGSLTIAETAEELGVSTGTVESDWNLARAWLRRELAAG